jgi:hypothetical protein
MSVTGRRWRAAPFQVRSVREERESRRRLPRPASFGILDALHVILLMTLVVASPDAGRWQAYATLGAGLQYNFPMPLVIRQEGQPDVRLTARYDTRPFFEVPYYDIRVGVERSRRGWELELVHHKLYLANRPEEADTFEISHGYNFITVNRAAEWRGLELRGGVGVVLTHPQTTIRGRRFSEDGGPLGWGFYVSGPAAQGAVAKQFPFGARFSVGGEGKVTAAFARIPVEGGSADVPNIALHGLLTLQYRF